MAIYEHLSTVTQKGQVTIPLAVRKALGIKPHDRIVFRVNNGQVQLLPSSMSLEAVYGAVKPLSKDTNWKEIRRIAREERLARRHGKIQRA